MLVLRVDLLLALQVVERREQGATLAVGGLETATAVWVDARDLNGLRKGVERSVSGHGEGELARFLLSLFSYIRLAMHARLSRAHVIIEASNSTL